MFYKLRKQNRLLQTIYTSSFKKTLYNGRAVTFRYLRQSDDVQPLESVKP